MYRSSLQISFLDNDVAVAELSYALPPFWPVNIVIAWTPRDMKNCSMGFSIEEGLGNIVLERSHTSYDTEHCPTACQDKRPS